MLIISKTIIDSRRTFKLHNDNTLRYYEIVHLGQIRENQGGKIPYSYKDYHLAIFPYSIQNH